MILERKNWREYVGRFAVSFEAINNDDLSVARRRLMPMSDVRRIRLSGLVDTGATSLVLPASAVKALGLEPTMETSVRYADGRRVTRKVVENVRVELLGRHGVFSAIVEPRRKDALVGAIVLEELDFIPDMKQQKLLPRDPNMTISEIE